MNSNPQRSTSLVGRLAACLSTVLVGYWAALAIVAPVTSWDSGVYNLARLKIAENGGFFNNQNWTNVRQVCFPWAFDAVHLPFLHLGWGFALPSFLCLLGILAAAWALMDDHFGRDAAWLSVLALLSLPTLVFQSANTKNDLAVLFGVSCWAYAVHNWRRTKLRWHLFFAALAIAFTAGSKGTGLLAGALCAGVSIWNLRGRGALRFCALTLTLGIFWGSMATYIESFRIYGGPFGPSDFSSAQENRDQVRGALANAVRYTFLNVNLGIGYNTLDRSYIWAGKQCHSTLKATGLWDLGIDPLYPDEHLRLLKTGSDSGSDYGTTGLLCLGWGFLALVYWKPQRFSWRIAIFGTVYFAIVCYTIAWMPWNDRFLMVSFAAWAMAIVAAVYETASRRWVRWALLGVFIYSSTIFPLSSASNKPSDLLAMVRNRQAERVRLMGEYGVLFRATDTWAKAHPGGQIIVLAGPNALVLPFLDQTDYPVKVLPASMLVRVFRDLLPSSSTLLVVYAVPGFHAPPGTSILAHYSVVDGAYLCQSMPRSTGT